MKRKWTTTSHHNVATARAMTVAELRDQTKQQTERRQAQEECDRQILQERESQAGPSQGFQFINEAAFILDIDDLEPPTPPRATSRRRISPPPSMSEPPPSTAPARLSGRGREVKKTAKKAEAQAAGYLPESQPRR